MKTLKCLQTGQLILMDDNADGSVDEIVITTPKKSSDHHLSDSLQKNITVHVEIMVIEKPSPEIVKHFTKGNAEISPEQYQQEATLIVEGVKSDKSVN